MKRIRFSIVVAVVVVVGLLLRLFTYQVRETEVVVKTFFGGDPQAITRPGLKSRWPWPVNSVNRFDGRLQISEGALGETSTRDGFNIVVSSTVGWKISDPVTFLKSTEGSMKIAEGRLLDRMANHQNSVLGRHPFSDLVSIEEKNLRFDEMEEEMTELLRVDASDEYGVKIAFVRITNLALPEEVTNKVFDRMRQERARIAKKTRAEGEGKARDIRARAESEKQIMLALAEGEAARIKGKGDAKAAEHYRVFAENGDLAIFLRKLESAKKTLKDRTTIILDAEHSPYDIFRGEVPGAGSAGGESLSGSRKEKEQD